jgi:methyl-accepting chemotaxis protein
MREIETVVEIIDDIAQRTNLLSVNAHIEAVHAGDTGTSFMVVAEEVRSLADRTRFSTQEIGETIKSIQEEIGRVQSLVKDNQSTVTTGKKTMKKTEETLSHIIAMVDNAMQMVRQIAVDSKAESTGARGISEEVEAIGAITRETAEGVASMAKTVQELNAQTETLRNAISRFQLR